MAVNVYSTLPRSPELGRRHQMQSSVISIYEGYSQHILSCIDEARFEFSIKVANLKNIRKICLVTF